MEITTMKNATKTGMTMSIEIITPQLASKFLETNHDNRHMSKKHIDFLATQMKNDKWLLTHQGIAFDDKGHLRDGQHRLYAVIQSMKDIEFLVVRNVPAETFTVMDTGKNRTAADVLYIEGYKNYSSELGAVCRSLLEWEAGAYRSVGKSTTRVTNYMILQYAEKNKKVLDVIGKVKTWAGQHKGVLNPTMAITFIWMFKELKDCDQQTAETFFEKIYTGANLGEHSPELYLRNWLIQEKFQLQKTGKQGKMAIIIKGWNKFRKNTPVTKMWHWNPKEEAFPIPI